MKQPTPHKYAEMIKEWADDPSRIIEFYYAHKDSWLKVDTPTWNPDNKFRFADQVTPVKPEIVSSLSDAELHDLTPMGKSTLMEIRRGVANAAAQRAHAEGYQAAIDAVCSMPCNPAFLEDYFDVLRSVHRFEGVWNNANRFAAESIARFQADVKKLLGGV